MGNTRQALAMSKSRLLKHALRIIYTIEVVVTGRFMEMAARVVLLRRLRIEKELRIHSDLSGSPDVTKRMFIVHTDLQVSWTGK